TWLLVLYLRFSLEFGQTYGPLAGIIGILLWAYLSSLALFLGLAFAAQLEGVRAGLPSPVEDR
ncbi:MAG: YihY/virulence factor BrkB family protein, partial [Actinobacteria bacterium]|nr:YihY/virulence factor BrkB family protein [Actinomycetota bacterium]